MDLKTSTAVTLLPALGSASADEDEKVDNEDVRIWRPPSCPTATDNDESKQDEDGYGGSDEVDVELNADDTTDLSGYEPHEFQIVPLLDRDVITCINNDDVTTNDDDIVESDNDDDEYKNIISRPIAVLKLSYDEAPEFIERLKAYNEVVEGNAVTFIAKFRAVPTPTIKWYKDEEEVRPTLRHNLDHTQTSSNEGTIRLTIDDVKTTDEGAYKVKVENQEGVASTTGYLSVSDGKKLRTKNRRSAKLSNVSTPPFLRPIAEQKSMEESEELELSLQPPSPLQDFIDSIRRSAKSKHPPIYYGTSADIFAVQTDEDDDVSPDQTDDNNSVEEDDDVFDLAVTPTSSESPLELLTANEIDDSAHMDDTWEALSVSAVDSVEFNGKRERIDTRIESNQHIPDAAPTSDITAVVDVVHASTSSSTLSKRRLGALQLQHRLAIDLPDYLPSSTTTTTSEQSHCLRTGQQPEIVTDATAIAQSDNSTSSSNALTVQQHISISSFTTSQTIAKIPAKESTSNPSTRLFQAAQDFLLSITDCPAVGFYLFFITVASALANTFEVQPVWLVISVAVTSFVSFVFVELFSSCRPSSSPPSTYRPLMALDL